MTPKSTPSQLLRGVPLGSPLTGHTGTVMWGAWGQMEDRAVLATSSTDDTVQLWDPATRQPLGPPLTGHTSTVMWGAWGQMEDRAVLATSSWDKTIRLWDPATGQPLGSTLTGHTGPVVWGAWGRMEDRAVLATGSTDKTIRLWDPATGQPLGSPLTGHTGPVLWGAWGRMEDRAVLATGSTDETVQLWDPATRQPLGLPLTGHTDAVLWGAWGRMEDRAVLATGSDDGTVRLWEVVEDRPVGRLPSYRSDAAGEADALSRAGDARALAELVTAQSARPPLAVGLFGDWGEGKSHFLDLLRRQVTIAARPDNPLAHNAVRQVWFNAWHYAETDLWASLVAELFSQLAKPDGSGDRGSEQRRQSRLMAEVIAERQLPQRLRAARERQEALQQAVRRADRTTVGSWATLTPEQQQQLTQVAGEDATKVYQSATRMGSGLAEAGRSIWALLRGLRRSTLVVAVLLLVAGAAGAVLIGWGALAVSRWWASAPAALTVIVAMVARTRVRVQEEWQRSDSIRQAVTQIVHSVRRADETQRARLQTAADVAAAEVAALEREMQNLTAAGQLAGFISDRAGAGDYRGRLGVMTQIREDFAHMATLLANARPSTPDSAGRATGSPAQPPGGAAREAEPEVDRDAANDELPRIDRIVLYIDDLDRCPPHRVVAMLEAIHLLLAVDLFVVVVAVDPRWLLRAISSHYHDLLHTTATASPPDDRSGMVDPDDEELWTSTPAQYLEKIFQVVLTLPPLDVPGYQQLLRTLVGTRPDQPAPAPATRSTELSPPSATTTASDAPTARPTPDATADDSMFGADLPAARVVERVDPLTLDPGELALLDLLGPPTLITTPRAVKRLANSYGLLTALRHEHRANDLSPQQVVIYKKPHGSEVEISYYPYRAGLVLLGALVAFPALGPALLVYLHRVAHEHPHHSWTSMLNDLQPRLHDQQHRWSNPADAVMTPVQAQHWQTLLHGLRDVTARAADAGLPLPPYLAAWQEWIVPVGRLSFPAGRIVNNLRHHQRTPKPDTDDSPTV